MDDIISQGGGREPSRWSRRLAAIAVLVVLAVVIVRLLPRESAAPPRHRALAVSAGPVQLAGLGSGAAVLLDKPGSSVRADREPVRRARRITARSLARGRLRHVRRVPAEPAHAPPALRSFFSRLAARPMM